MGNVDLDSDGILIFLDGDSREKASGFDGRWREDQRSPMCKGRDGVDGLQRWFRLASGMSNDISRGFSASNPKPV